MYSSTTALRTKQDRWIDRGFRHPMLRAVPYETSGESAYRAIRTDILFGRLPPGTRLRLDALSTTYGASVSTLRETLNRLTTECLVTAEQRGFEVTPITQEEFSELAALRELLEIHAMRGALAKGDLDWEGRIVGAYHKLARLEEVMLAGDRRRSDEWKRYDREFHHAIVSACGSGELLTAYGAVFDRYLRYQNVAVIFRGQEAANEHRALMEAALDRRGDDVAALLHQHISACVDHSLTHDLLSSRKRRPPREDMDITSIGEAAWRRVRADILMGVLAPGQKLRLDRLRADYGVSVSTLREILNRLTSEGLVVAEGQRGFEVAPVSAENLEETANLRLLIEGQALEASFSAGDVDWEARVVSSYHKLLMMETRMAQGDEAIAETWKQYDWQFHQALISACGSQALMQMHGAVFDKYLRYQMIALSFRGNIAAGEHRALHDCALRRDAEGARKVLTTHLAGGMAHALAAGTMADAFSSTT